jgi:PAS domain S-box-containing protein
MADRIIDANPAINEITGYSQVQLIGKPFDKVRYQLFTPADYSKLNDSSEEIVIKLDKERYFEVRNNPVTYPIKN